ncbi:MAG: class I SAM-dependent methyltransferase [Rhodobiaceae bacterium]|nr:class I SAM-dependent methyltransferase [Rhodobiaceae bacterium]
MGITQSAIEKLDQIGLFKKDGMAVLDVGSSNLYSASEDGVVNFLSQYAPDLENGDVSAFAKQLTQGSGYDLASGGTNDAFVGQLFEKAGFVYNAIDIADGYRTTIVDLNHQNPPEDFVGKFDLVLNFGTTEHLLNQYNAFRFIHNSVKVGGYIVHSLPCVGYSNHGYLTYTPRCFFDLAGYNQYEVTDFWYDAVDTDNDLFAPLRDYATYFPTLNQTIANSGATSGGQIVTTLNVPDVAIFIVMRKVHDTPFVGPMETSTSVGDVLPDGQPSTSSGTAAVESGAGGAEASKTAPTHSKPRQLAIDLRDAWRAFVS